MTVASLLKHLAPRGFQSDPADGGNLRARAPIGVVTPKLRDALLSHKPTVLRTLRWPVLVPAGWPSSAWVGRLRHIAKVCMHADRAREFERWVETVADVYGLDTEVGQ